MRRSGFDPWRWFRARPRITLGFADLPERVGGEVVWVPSDDPDSAVVVLQRGMTAIERNAKAAHAIVHIEKRVTGDPRIDERGVDDEVARLLVPTEELAALVASICNDGTPIMAWEIAEAFDVPDEIAERACVLLRSATRRSA